MKIKLNMVDSFGKIYISKIKPKSSTITMIFKKIVSTDKSYEKKINN